MNVARTNAEVIAIGSELTCGARLDTNSQWLSRELEALGWTVQRHTTVADDHEAMVRVFQEAAQRSRIVIITGGLGPTLDDITRDTLAEAFGQPLVEDASALRHIEELFRSRGRDMPERNKVQALRPAGAQTLHNAHGTAPGILLKLTEPECLIGVLPGVPAEMMRMFFEQLVDVLPGSQVFVKRSTIRTFGYGESDAERLLGDLTARGRNPEVGITASGAVISLSVTARAGSDEECDLLAEAAREQIRNKLGTAVFTENDEELEDVVARLIASRKLKIGLLEGTTTGGLIGQWLTEEEHSAHLVSYSRLFPTAASMNETDPANWLRGVREIATSLLDRRTADYVLISSPATRSESDGGARMRCGSVRVVGQGFDRELDVSMTGNLAIFRERAARTALNLLRLQLLRTQ
ncbi:MAG: molybdopterin-binding protein [Planctomycetaceae bacterium]